MKLLQEQALSTMSPSEDPKSPSDGSSSCDLDNIIARCSDDSRHEETSSTIMPTMQQLPQEPQLHHQHKTSAFYSPPAVTPHIDYRSKAEIRRAELEALRQQKLAQPKAALLQTMAPSNEIQNLADFEQMRRRTLEQMRENQKLALENLHHYRADEQALKMATPEKQSRHNHRSVTSGLSQPPDAIASVYEYDTLSSSSSFNQSNHHHPSIHHSVHISHTVPDANAMTYLTDSRSKEAVELGAPRAIIPSPNTVDHNSASQIPMASLMRVARTLMDEEDTVGNETSSSTDHPEDANEGQWLPQWEQKKEQEATTSSSWTFGPVILPTRSSTRQGEEWNQTRPVLLPSRNQSLQADEISKGGHNFGLAATVANQSSESRDEEELEKKILSLSERSTKSQQEEMGSGIICGPVILPLAKTRRDDDQVTRRKNIRMESTIFRSVTQSPSGSDGEPSSEDVPIEMALDSPCVQSSSSTSNLGMAFDVKNDSVTLQANVDHPIILPTITKSRDNGDYGEEDDPESVVGAPLPHTMRTKSSEVSSTVSTIQLASDQTAQPLPVNILRSCDRILHDDIIPLIQKASLPSLSSASSLIILPTKDGGSLKAVAPAAAAAQSSDDAASVGPVILPSTSHSCGSPARIDDATQSSSLNDAQITAPTLQVPRGGPRAPKNKTKKKSFPEHYQPRGFSSFFSMAAAGQPRYL